MLLSVIQCGDDLVTPSDGHSGKGNSYTLDPMFHPEAEILLGTGDSTPGDKKKRPNLFRFGHLVPGTRTLHISHPCTWRLKWRWIPSIFREDTADSERSVAAITS